MSTNSQVAATTFLAVGERIIGYCLNNTDKIADLRGRLPDGLLFPQRPIGELGTSLSAVWGTLLQQADAGVSMSPETVADGAGASPDMLMRYANNEAYTKPADIEELVGILVKHGKAAAKRRIGTALQSEDPAKHLSAGEAIAQLSALETYGLHKRDTSAAALADKFENAIETVPPKANPTGIPILDVALWELPIYEMSIISAPYKSGKSRALTNIVLASSARGSRAFVALCEGQVESFTTNCLAMIANQWIIRIGQWQSPDNKLHLTGKYLERSRAWRNNNLHAEAVSVAVRIYKQLPLTIWDAADGASSPMAVLAEARSQVSQGATLLCLDYIQDLELPGDSVYEQMVHARSWARKVKQLGLHCLILSQMSEETIKGGSNKKGGLVKGGGDMSAECDHLLTPSYDDAMPGILKMPLRFSRHNAGLDMQFNVEMTSGLITGYTRYNDTSITDEDVNIIPLKMLLASGTQISLTADDGNDGMILD